MVNMKKFTSAVLLLAGLTFAHAADLYAPVGNTLADALQWLAVQTACMGQYNMAEFDITREDPQDNYRPPDIREYLARMSGDRTRVPTFYGICFDYAKAAYDHIMASQGNYEGLGMKRGQWYIAAAFESSREIVLFKPVAQGQHSMVLNGVYVKESGRFSVQTHNNATTHGWLWVYGNDGTIYWLDPNATDDWGYVVWGVVRNGREEQVAPQPSLCAGRIPGGASFASLSRGDANRSQGNWNQAIEDYNEVIRVEPNYELAYNNRGLANYNKGAYDQAIADFNEAIRLNPNYADAYRNRGRAYYAKGGYDQALADYNQALSLNSNDAPAYNGRAYVYLAKKDIDRAVADVNQAIRLWPREATWYATRGEIFLNIGEYKRAAAEFELALRMTPSFTRAKELLQRAKRRR
jgi:tetratricopeptide (TPR) repeat protein